MKLGTTINCVYLWQAQVRTFSHKNKFLSFESLFTSLWFQPERDRIFKSPMEGLLTELWTELRELKSRDGEAPGPAKGLEEQMVRTIHRGCKQRGQRGNLSCQRSARAESNQSLGRGIEQGDRING